MPRLSRDQSGRSLACPFLVERQAGFDPGSVTVGNHRRFCKPALASCGFGFQKVTAPRFGANQFPGSGDFKTFGDRLSGLAAGNGLWHKNESPSELPNLESHAMRKFIIFLLAGNEGISLSNILTKL